MSRNGKRARTALTVALVWTAASGTAAAGAGAVLPWGGGRAATAVALQAEAQELAAWEAERDAAYEAAVHRAVSAAEKWRAAAVTASGAEGGRPSASRGRGATADGATVSGSAAGGSAAGGSDRGRGTTDWGAEIEEALDTPQPRPGSTPGTDPEHRQRVEDASTDPVEDLTYDPAP
ncbi:hypothetical protein ABTY20_05300 [Streptomyces sp. NPDC126497]|uniref:hypothetical protein n=1 Tax=Streptomyces sp. NPDC126497 TaxID=3155313 RepID=UPI00332ED1FE